MLPGPERVIITVDDQLKCSVVKESPHLCQVHMNVSQPLARQPGGAAAIVVATRRVTRLTASLSVFITRCVSLESSIPELCQV